MHGKFICTAGPRGYRSGMIAKLFSPRLMQLLFWLAGAFSLVMALLPQPPSLAIDQFGDKFAHVLAFVVLTLLGRLAWPRAPWWTLVLGLACYGAVIELFQMIPELNRDAELRDWAADFAAITLTALAAQFLIRFLPSRDTN